MEESKSILDCPFCGTFGLPLEVRQCGPSKDYRQWCHHCGALGPNRESVKEAHEAWNRRVVAPKASSNRRSAVALHALVRCVRDTNGTTGMEYNDFIQNVEKLCNFAEALQAELDGADKVIAHYAQASNDRTQV